jgi:hypothetical protein
VIGVSVILGTCLLMYCIITGIFRYKRYRRNRSNRNNYSLDEIFRNNGITWPPQRPTRTVTAPQYYY